ncbi:tandem-95 repeat protein, partial [Ideonella livida]|uniref:tandem-95 repeat protein n=1 Tax=Ideonella livida TaxID=2707176 RepID=UPI00287388D6
MQVTVNPVNDAPEGGDVTDPDWDATDGRYELTTDEDIPVGGTVAAGDADGDTLAFSVDTHPSNGSITIDAATGVYTYTPDAGWSGVDSFIVLVDDGNGGQTPVTVQVTVNPVNDAPEGGDVTDPDWDATDGRYELTTDEDTPVGGTVAAGDADGDTLTFTLDADASHGTIALDPATGVYTYTPDAGWSGVDSFVVLVDDGNGGQTPVTVQVTVNPVNDAPEGGDVTDPDWDATDGRYELTTDEDTPVGGTVAAGDADGDTLTFTLDSDASHGTIALDPATGVYTYTPDAGWSGVDSFVVLVDDGNGGQTPVTVQVTVNPVNDAPEGGDVTDPDWDATDGRYELTTDEDTPVGGTVAAGDADGDTLAFSVDTDPTHGSVSLDPATGVYTYTPDAGWSGVDSFVVLVDDGNGGQTPVTVQVTVNPVNDAPEGGDVTDPDWDATDGRYELSTDEDTPVGGTVAAGDADGDTLAFSVDTHPSNGSVTIDAATGIYTYTPDAGWSGVDSFIVLVDDGNGGQTPVTVQVTVNPVNDAPEGGDVTDPDWDATDGRYELTTDEDTPVGGTVAAGDADGDTLAFSVDTDPTHGSVSLDPATGVYTYTPDAGWSGVDSFVVLVDDGNGGQTPVTVQVTVNPVNDAPEGGDVTDPDWDATDGRYELTTDEDTPVGGTVAAGDADGDTLTFTLDADASHGTIALDPATGVYTYTPDAGWSGVDSFIVLVDDGNGGQTPVTVQVTVNPVNDAPEGGDVTDPDWDATDGRYELTTDEDTPVGGTVAAGDADGDTLAFSVDTDPTHGSVSLDPATGVYTYTPDAGWSGVDSFVVLVDDGNGGQTPVTVQVTVNPVNDAPEGGDVTDPDWDATDGRYELTTDEDTPVGGTVAAGDADGDTLAFSVDTDPTHGSVSLDPATGVYTYTPDAGWSGVDSFVVLVDDGNGGQTPVTVQVTVNPVNDAPEGGDVTDPDWDATDGRYELTTDEDTPVGGTVAAGDADGDTLAFSVDTDPTHGTVSLDPATGVYTYTPDAGWSGVDSFIVLVDDGNGGQTPVTVQVTVNPVNDAPEGGDVTDPDWDATDGRYELTTDEDTPVGGTVAAGDTDGDTLAFSVDTDPTHGTVSLDPATGVYTYTPDAGWSGVDSFIVLVDDGNGGQTPVTVQVTVNPVNDAPEGGDVTDPDWDATDGRYELTTDEDTPVGGTVAAGDADGDTLAFSVDTHPSNGSVTIDAATGVYTYTPDAGWSGVDSFVVLVDDGNGGQTPVTVQVTVNPVNDAPEGGDVTDPDWDATDGRYELTTDEDTPVGGTVAAGDTDGDTLAFSVDTDPTHGTVSLDPATGVYTYTPDAGWSG